MNTMNIENAKKLFHTLTNIFISSYFGYRDAVKDSKGNIIAFAGFHTGTDYSANGNSVPVYAIEDGIVLSEGKDGNGAIFCYIHYPRLGYVGLCYHLTCTYISKGNKVNKDTKLGMTGKTGLANGIHLDFSWFKYSDYSKAFSKRTYEDYNAFIFDTIVPVADKNEDIAQIKVLADKLNVRTNHNTSNQSLGYAVKNGIYNDLEVYNDGKLTWHRIADNQWVADNGTWLELYSVMNYKNLYEDIKKENEIILIEINKYKGLINQIKDLSTLS